MNKAEFLELPSRFTKVRNDRLRLEYLRMKAEGVKAIELKERVQSSPIAASNVFIEMAIDLEREILAEEAEINEKAAEANDFIKNALEGAEADVMILRYVSGLRWSEIEHVLSYSEASVHRIHRAGKDKLFSRLKMTV